MGIKLSLKLLCGDGEQWVGQGQPVHPISHSLSLAPLAVCINVVFEFEEQRMDVSPVKKVIGYAILSRNPLFSCIMVIALLLLFLLYISFKDYFLSNVG